MPSLIVHPEGYAADNDFDFGQIASTTVSFDRQNYFNPLFSLEAAWPLVIRNQDGRGYGEFIRLHRQ